MRAFFLGMVAVAGMAGMASAATVYPIAVVSTDSNGTDVSADRNDPTAAWDGDTSTFYTLGIGGSIVLDFGLGKVTTPGGITEVTYNPSGYNESVYIYVSDTLDFSDTPVAYVTNQGDLTTTLSFSTDSFRYVKLVDNSSRGFNRDGFDLAEISFSPVPVPAAGLLLGGALFGLGALRRRVRKSA